MLSYASVFTLVLVVVAIAYSTAAKKDTDPVTCGSVIKLIHKETVAEHCNAYLACSS